MPDPTTRTERPRPPVARPPYVRAIVVLNPGDHVQATRRLFAIGDDALVVLTALAHRGRPPEAPATSHSNTASTTPTSAAL
ncbi:hypothetical protein [Embleya sp. NPDC001921]